MPNRHIVQRYNCKQPDRPQAVPHNPQSSQIPVSRIDIQKGKFNQPVQSLLHNRQQNRQGQKDSYGCVICQNRCFEIHGLKNFVEVVGGDHSGNRIGIVLAVSRLVVLVGKAKETSKPLGAVVVEASDGSALDWFRFDSKSILHNHSNTIYIK